MALTDQQDIWVQQVRTTVEKLIQVTNSLEDKRRVYDDRDLITVIGGDPDALQEIEDKYDVAPADLVDAMAFVTAFTALLDNGVPEPGEWRAVLNRIRELQ